MALGNVVGRLQAPAPLLGGRTLRAGLPRRVFMRRDARRCPQQLGLLRRCLSLRAGSYFVAHRRHPGPPLPPFLLCRLPTSSPGAGVRLERLCTNVFKVQPEYPWASGLLYV